jgi:hypothetical protein
MNMINISTNKNTYLYSFFYVVIILIIIAGLLVPSYIAKTRNVRENQKIKDQIREQKELGPLYVSLLAAMNDKGKLVLPNPEKKPVSRAEAVKFQDDLRAIAKKSGMIVVLCASDLNTPAGVSTFFYNIVLKGQYADFRKIIIGLGSIPYLDRIEEISCQQGTDNMEFKIKVWIAIK